MSCVVAADCGVGPAKGLGDANENYGSNNCEFAGLDLHNNEQGRRLGAGANASDCEGLALGALSNGDLRWLDFPRPANGICDGVLKKLPPGDPCTP